MRGQVPWCQKCNKQVDAVEWDTPVEALHGWQGSTLAHTGEVTIVVSCHGETWRARRSRLGVWTVDEQP